MQKIPQSKTVKTIPLIGDFTKDTIPLRRHGLLAAVREQRHLILDVASIGIWDTALVALFVEVFAEGRRHGHMISLQGVGERLSQAFTVNRLDGVFLVI